MSNVIAQLNGLEMDFVMIKLTMNIAILMVVTAVEIQFGFNIALIVSVITILMNPLTINLRVRIIFIYT